MTFHFHILHLSKYCKQPINIEAESVILFLRGKIHWEEEALKSWGSFAHSSEAWSTYPMMATFLGLGKGTVDNSLIFKEFAVWFRAKIWCLIHFCLG